MSSGKKFVMTSDGNLFQLYSMIPISSMGTLVDMVMLM